MFKQMIEMNTRPFSTYYSIHELTEAIVVILNARDPYTFEHSWRVSALAEKIASCMNIAPQWEEVIHVAAHLHDIGKIGVPDFILNKPEKLTSDEYEMVKEHSEIGYKIISSLPQLNEIALYVRHHHERWDGQGYPCGLKEKEIPLGARIIAVADTFDAITSSRPYRDSRDYNYAFAEIAKSREIQLCPEVTDIFIELRNEIPAIIDEVNKEIEARNLI